MAIGAVARIECGGRKQMREVRSQSSFLSQNSPVLHFGLGSHAQAERIEIQWPSGTKTVLENVKADQRLFIREEAKESAP